MTWKRLSAAVCRAALILLMASSLMPVAVYAADTPSEPADAPAVKSQTGLPIPRFVSITAARVNLRMGPGRQYPIAWVLQRRQLPVEIIDEFEHWRKIREQSGGVGWVHKTMLSSKRMGLVTASGQSNELVPVYPKNTPAKPAMMAEAGAIGKISQCNEVWCAIQFEQGKGWIRRDNLWGLYPGEAIE